MAACRYAPDGGRSIGRLSEDRAQLRGVLSSIITRAGAAGVPVGVHAYSGNDAAGFAAEGATIVTVAVDMVSLAEVMTHHLGVARGPAVADRL